MSLAPSKPLSYMCGLAGLHITIKACLHPQIPEKKNTQCITILSIWEGALREERKKIMFLLDMKILNIFSLLETGNGGLN